MSGQETRDYRLVEDLQGNLVDPRFGTLDSADNLDDANVSRKGGR